MSQRSETEPREILEASTESNRRDVLAGAFAALAGALAVGGDARAQQPAPATAQPAAAGATPIGDKWWPSKWGPEDQAGASNHITPAKILDALKSIKSGKVYEIGRVYESSMPKFGDRAFTLRIPGSPTGGPLGNNKIVWHDEYLATEIGSIRGLLRAKKYLAQVAAQGSLVLFVGTKKQAGPAVERESLRCHMPFVAERWLGGCLTNFRTIRSRLGRLEEVEKVRGGDEIATYSKKAQSALAREYRKMFRNLNGIRTLNRMPECLVIIDPNKEKNAVKEARALGITTVSLIDTDCDPDLVDLPIPGNDDSIRSIELVAARLADAVLEGKASSATEAQAAAEGAEADGESKPKPKARPMVAKRSVPQKPKA